MSKTKGSNAERELVHKFWEYGWACIRVAGSGSSKYPSPDLLAGNARRKLAIECKITGGVSQYFDEEEIESLRFFAKTFGAESWVAIKMERKWRFLMLEDLKETPSGFAVNANLFSLKGLTFEELVKG